MKRKKDFAELAKREVFAKRETHEIPILKEQLSQQIREARLIPIQFIKPDPEQVRKASTGDDASLKDLTASVKAYGILQPLVVEYISDENYKIVNGYRRYRAGKMAHLSRLPCLLKRDLSPTQRSSMQLIENLQREDLSPLDEAAALKKVESYGYTHQQVGEMIGKSRTYVTVSLRLLSFPGHIQRGIAEAGIPKSTLVEIARRPKNQRETLLKKALKGMPRAELRQRVKKKRPAVDKIDIILRQVKSLKKKILEVRREIRKERKQMLIKDLRDTLKLLTR